MTSAVVLARYSLLALVIGCGALVISSYGWAQTDDAAETDDDQGETKAIDRGKMRLGLLLSLVKNELRAANLEKTQLMTERSKLARERATLSATGNRERPAVGVRLEQIVRRLEAIDKELLVVDGRLPEITDELDDLQRRLDEANGIVREAALDTSPDSTDQANGQVSPVQPSASVWLDGKRQIQEALVYLGSYNALIDGDFGPRTAEAVKVYQERQGLDQTGRLTEEQETSLLDEANALRQLYGVQTFTDPDFSYRLSFPAFLLSETEKLGTSGRRMATPDGEGELLITVADNPIDLTELYEDAAAQYEVQYRRRRDDWFVVAGLLDQDRIIYDTVRQVGEKLYRARLSYPVSQRDLWSPFAVIMFNTFEAVPAS